MARLGVNIDHVATLRQARRAEEPDPVAAAVIVENAGADSITVHLREDRRHINDRDVLLLRKTIRTRLNLEMAIAADIVDFACRTKPDQATLVPEKRRELTTEGGLDVFNQRGKVKKTVVLLREQGIIVSIFIEPDKRQIAAAAATGAECVELHTGAFANARGEKEAQARLKILAEAAVFAAGQGLRVNAGHGLNYVNTKPLLQKISGIEELNIGHAIISRAVLVGLDAAVKEMKTIIEAYGK